jgi:uncharacterized membrane protein YhaH (DUF805 family)
VIEPRNELNGSVDAVEREHCNGMGNAVITAFLLLLTALISWFVVHAKSRTLRLLGGVSSNRIHIEDTSTIIKLSAPSFFAGWIVVLGYVAVVGGVKQISLISWQALMILVVVLILFGALVMGISLLVSPKTCCCLSLNLTLQFSPPITGEI